ncbi:flagellar hook-length control protein FliK [Aliarcobacter trophiarum LMG 25534]|uniref:Flagellar hook-length control protein FliK n=1 Tax=Aliarcobacter trophiarum LMG 25534 TaxID=1032241 RepID=A0AAD0QKJ6_9BACT|nr:flagellar hook-length control protein FliK [Aliarcobacter trophiarum]AXK49176.1 flagellar hook-length control protein FliK [Aliarcobacter trophiarum LMG 25534]RXI25501.1 flagellar hook-length control protein FliK [Aliarcobacter trophiarum]RXJ89807.1 flagellar hook-length control protein FliK [Aliarcobacter trophiarum LMG 25534]
MLISNGTALNILLANNNRVLNDALKEVDNKTLNNLLKQDSSSSSIDASKVLKEVLNAIKDGSKSASTLENIIKNSNVFKDLGTISTNISSLLDSIKDDETLQKFKPLLENFLKNIKDINPENLKEQIKNSGVFLENKLTQNSNIKLENLLQNISNLLKNIDTPIAKEITQSVNNILKSLSNNTNSPQTSINELKNLITNLQNLSNSLTNKESLNLTSLANELKNFINSGQLVEAKIESLSKQNLQQNVEKPILSEQILKENIDIKNLINNQTKELLSQIKQEISQNPLLLQNRNIAPILDKLLAMPDLFSKSEAILNSVQNSNISNFLNNFSSNLTPLLTTLKESLHSLNPKNEEILKELNTLIKKVENIINDNLNNHNLNKNSPKLDDDFKSMLLKMQEEVASKTDIKSQDSLKSINNLLTQIDMHQLGSIVSNSNFVYIPFFWEMLEDGSIEIKQKDEEKFFCQIKLTLKDFGKIDLMLSLYDENKLDITIYAQREHFKIALRENLQKLKLALNDANIITMNVKLLDMKDYDEKKEDKPNNIYQNHYNNDMFSSQRVDIKV